MKYSKPGVWKKIISSKITFIVALLLLIVMIRATNEIRSKNTTSISRLDLARNEYKKLEAYKTELENKISFLSTTEGIETELRTKFRAVKDGEKVAVIVEKNREDASTSSSQNNTVNVKDGLWDKLLDFFGF